MPLVSIIIPAHNASRTIRECVASAIHQSHSDLEIIVINDSSADNTSEKVKSLDDPRITLTEISRQSAAAARNAGLSMAKGDLIQFLDADDVLSPNKLESQISRLRTCGPKTIGNCPWAHFSDSINQAKTQNQPINRDISALDWLIESWNGGGMAQTACWLTPRELIEKAGPWDETLQKNPNDDGEFFCRVLLQAADIAFSPDTLVYYKKPSGPNVSQIKSELQASSLLQSYFNYEKHMLQSTDSHYIREALAQNYYRFIYQFCNSYPTLCDSAKIQLHKLGNSRSSHIGGRFFRVASNLLGFQNAILLRRLNYLLTKNTSLLSPFF